MTKDHVDDLKDLHNRDIDRLDKEIDKKVNRATFEATIAPIRKTSALIIGAVISVGGTIIAAIIIPLL